MADINDITNGLRIPGQIPLDSKLYCASEAVLANLGTSNNLAYTYYKGMVIYCVAEQTRYEWREVVGIESGLLPSHFTYPSGLVVFGIDYSNKVYNFFEVSVGGALDQNNFVRTLPIEFEDLGIFDAEDATPAMICNYVNTFLPVYVIDDTDSKWNILIQETTDDFTIVYKIYEIINIGKGNLDSLVPDNLLLINKTAFPVGLEDVINQNSIIEALHPILMTGSGGLIFAATVNNAGVINIYGQDKGSNPSMVVGVSDINGNAKTSLDFYNNKTLFKDTLNKGVEYAGDYEANFTDRSLVTKQYVDDVTATGAYRVYVARITLTGGVYTVELKQNTIGVIPTITFSGSSTTDISFSNLTDFTKNWVSVTTNFAPDDGSLRTGNGIVTTSGGSFRFFNSAGTVLSSNPTSGPLVFNVEIRAYN